MAIQLSHRIRDPITFGILGIPIVYLLDRFLGRPGFFLFGLIMPFQAFCLAVLIFKKKWIHLHWAILLVVADYSTRIRTFYFKSNTHSLISVLLISLSFSFFYFFLSIWIVKKLKSEKVPLFNKMDGLASASIIIPITSMFLVPSLYGLTKIEGFSFYIFARTLNTISASVLFYFSLNGFLRAKSLQWTSICLGAAVLILVNFTFSSEIYLGKAPYICFYHYVWVFGELAIFIPVLSDENRLLDGFYKRVSVTVQLRRIILLLTLFLLFILLQFIGTNITLIRTAFFSILCSLLISVYLGRALTYQLRSYSILLCRYVTDTFALEGKPSTEGLPVELSELFEEVLSKHLLEIVFEQKYRKNISEQAAQVSHDIRSPLAALEMVVSHLSQLPEEYRILIRSSVGRIRDISHQLAETKRNFEDVSATSPIDEPFSVALLSGLINNLVSEKRLEYRERLDVQIESQLDPSTYGIFSKIQIGAIMRTLSNLINNSIESIESKGRVVISLAREGEMAVLSVEDTGRGIPSEIIPLLGKQGLTYAKRNGSGLGLYLAHKTLQQNMGSLTIHSVVNEGTKVVCFLPMTPAPEWFVPSIELSSGTSVVILDDDLSIHEIWKSRFTSIPAFSNPVHHFSSLSQLESWILENSFEAPPLYLCDFELLGSKLNGLDLIEKLEIAENSILVTSRFEDLSLLERCRVAQVKVLPKGLATQIPIHFQ